MRHNSRLTRNSTPLQLGKAWINPRQKILQILQRIYATLNLYGHLGCSFRSRSIRRSHLLVDLLNMLLHKKPLPKHNYARNQYKRDGLSSKIDGEDVCLSLRFQKQKSRVQIWTMSYCHKTSVSIFLRKEN